MDDVPGNVVVHFMRQLYLGDAETSVLLTMVVMTAEAGKHDLPVPCHDGVLASVESVVELLSLPYSRSIRACTLAMCVNIADCVRHISKVECYAVLSNDSS